MLTYQNLGQSIKVSLPNNYSIIAFYIQNKEKAELKISYYLKENTVDLLNLIGEIDDIKFSTDIKAIKTEIAKHITRSYYKGAFRTPIEDYEYILRCFDRGNMIFEEEEGINANV